MYSDNEKKDMYSNFEEPRNELVILAMFFTSCFASFENIAYTIFNIKVLPVRLITASLFHIFIAPYYLKAISKTKNINFSFLALPIILHGAYNMFITMGGFFLAFSFIIILFLLIQTLSKLLRCH